MKRVILLAVLIACLASIPAMAVDTNWAVAPDVYPYSAIAYMEVHKSCGCSGLYTGFMVAPDLMMTAA